MNCNLVFDKVFLKHEQIARANDTKTFNDILIVVAGILASPKDRAFIYCYPSSISRVH